MSSIMQKDDARTWVAMRKDITGTSKKMTKSLRHKEYRFLEYPKRLREGQQQENPDKEP